MSNNIEVFEYNDPNARFGFTPNSILNLKEMSNKKQSSIDWLEWQINLGLSERGLISAFKEAKAMHKEEIEETFFQGAYGGDIISAEQYYNETFGGDNE